MTKLRLEKAKKHNRLKASRDAQRLKRWDYMEAEGNVQRGAFCKLCGTQIRGLHDTGQIVDKDKNLRLGILRENHAYSEIEITMEDGSKHVTPICRKCANSSLKKEQLEDIFMADLDRLAEVDPMEAMNYDLELERVPKSYRVLR